HAPAPPIPPVHRCRSLARPQRPVLRHRRDGTRARRRRDRRMGEPLVRLAQPARRRRDPRTGRRVGRLGRTCGRAPRSRVGGGRPVRRHDGRRVGSARLRMRRGTAVARGGPLAVARLRTRGRTGRDRQLRQPALHAPILALALTGDTLVAVTPDQFAWRDPATRAWTLVHERAELGQVTTLAPDEGGVWVGGTNGLAFWDLAHASFRVLLVPD